MGPEGAGPGCGWEAYRPAPTPGTGNVEEHFCGQSLGRGGGGTEVNPKAPSRDLSLRTGSLQTGARLLQAERTRARARHGAEPQAAVPDGRSGPSISVATYFRG